jgi:hypothetical protein
MERALEEGLHFDGHPVRGIVQPALPGAILPVVAGIEPPRAADDEDPPWLPATRSGYRREGLSLADRAHVAEDGVGAERLLQSLVEPIHRVNGIPPTLMKMAWRGADMAGHRDWSAALASASSSSRR